MYQLRVNQTREIVKNKAKKLKNKRSGTAEQFCFYILVQLVNRIQRNEYQSFNFSFNSDKEVFGPFSETVGSEMNTKMG